ncbi:MAG TPA: methyl-accepting chemotaxis protein [Thermodesulfobacteriota bacterium]|nr:methyl-accepting chemotaxis protein [Thermodesulfobacteriota bacterium]
MPTDRNPARRGLSIKFLIFVNSLFLIMGAVLALTLLIGFKQSTERHLRGRGLAIAGTVASQSRALLERTDGAPAPESGPLGELLRGLARQTDVAYIAVLDPTGTAVAHTEASLVGRRLDDPLTRHALAATGPAVLQYRRDGESFYDVIVPVQPAAGAAAAAPSLGVVRVGLALATLQAEFRRYLTIAVSLLALLLAAGVFISLFFVRVITAPLARMTEAALRIAAGDLTQTVPVDTQDEVGILARAFAYMLASLKEVVSKILDTSQAITAVGDQVLASVRRVKDGATKQAVAVDTSSASIEEMNNAIRQIAESIEALSTAAESSSASLTQMSTAIGQVAESAVALSGTVDETVSAISEMFQSIQQLVEHIDALSASAEETTASMTEMTASIKQVEQHARDSTAVTEKASQDASQLGIAAIERTIEGMETIKRAVDQSALVINKLGGRTEQIGRILTVIDEVTEQTNLLALNAAILAAKAGQEGRGFAVVADEIKSLAERTAASTKEIAQLILDVQTETRDAVASINEGAKSVEEGVRLSTSARESFAQILESTRRATETSRQIERATREQVRAAAQVAQLMDTMNTMVKRVRAVIKEHELGLRHITASADKMRWVSQQVKASAEEQAKGSKQISSAVDDVSVRIQQIARAIREQRTGNAVIMQTIVQIQQAAELSVQMAQEVTQSLERLMKQAGALRAEVERFSL